MACVEGIVGFGFRSQRVNCITTGVCHECLPVACLQHHNTALHEAALENHSEIVELLLQNKASVSLQNYVI